ncbi:hypothetical protein [Cyclobacterium qasimii]|uniref:hypothetical protein n=1 Tax=Cyclobacterium qasimii TaxID=1350429 RepID=UPI001F2ACFF4|nr:hypothetical protein [Cyclobacterium qasimii]
MGLFPAYLVSDDTWFQSGTNRNPFYPFRQHYDYHHDETSSGQEYRRVDGDP